MKFIPHIIVVALIAGCQGEKSAEVIFSPNDCKRQPPFVKTSGFRPDRVAFSTSDKKKMGLLLMEINDAKDTTGKGIRYYQHESWKKAGWLAPIQLDNKGNLFTAPAPFINVLNNPGDKQNIVYKVDATTGVMAAFADLPQTEKPNIQNAYGVLGLTFMCETERLFAASVAGSSRQKEAGGIYSIDGNTGVVKDRLKGWDAFGLGISTIEGQRKLYFGKARSSDIYAIALSEKGNFVGQPQLCISLDGLGPRGDDKAKKITFNPKGDMKVEGYEFNFNLIAPTEKQVSYFYFRYNANTEKWEAAAGNW